MASEQNLASLKKRRAVIQGSCTRIKTFVDSVVSVTSTIAAQLEERRTKLSSNMSEYESVQAEIELLDESEENNRINFEEAFYSCENARTIIAAINSVACNNRISSE